MQKAFSYIRFSSTAQAEGDSLNRQMSATRKYATDHELELDESLVDRGISAYRGKNVQEGALGSFLKLVHEGKIPRGSVLIVEDLDRLSRQDPIAAQTLFNSIVVAGVEIVTLRDGQRYSRDTIAKTPTILLQSLLRMILAHEESDKKSERVKAAKKRAREDAVARKTPISARAPFWLRLPRLKEVGRGATRKFEIVPERAAVVRRVFHEYVTLGLGYMRIANRLNEGKITAPEGKKGWHPSSVQWLIRNDAVIGIYRAERYHNGKRDSVGEPIEGYFPAIIDRELFLRAQSVKNSRFNPNRRQAGRRSPSGENLFHGLTRCGHCGGSMGWRSLQNRKRITIPHYQCREAHYKKSCDNNRIYRFEQFRDGVLKNISEFVFNSEDSEAKRIEHEIEAAASHIEELRKKHVRLTKFVEDGDDDELVRTRLRQLISEIRSAEGKHQKLKDQHVVVSVNPEISARQTSASELIEKMSKLEGEDLFSARAALSHDLRAMIEVIIFSKDFVSVILHGNKNAYAFRDGELISSVPRLHIPTDHAGRSKPFTVPVSPRPVLIASTPSRRDRTGQ